MIPVALPERARFANRISSRESILGRRSCRRDHGSLLLRCSLGSDDQRSLFGHTLVYRENEVHRDEGMGRQTFESQDPSANERTEVDLCES